MIKEIERFQAVSDSGNKYTVLIYQKFIDASTAEDPNKYIPGIKSARTLDGQPLNRIDDKSFEIVETGEIITRI